MDVEGTAKKIHERSRNFPAPSTTTKIIKFANPAEKLEY
jgi:hypothetical protein